jgi:phosphatidylinositol alpha-1,6-mannosyltransferase
MLRALETLAAELEVSDDVVLAGAVPWVELPPYFAAGDVFCMPCRTRKLGFEVEGLGIVFLEASATGLPVVAGSSGGAPDAVLEGRTGLVVDGRAVSALAAALVSLLGHPEAAGDMGAEGRRWVQHRWQWAASADRLREALVTR